MPHLSAQSMVVTLLGYGLALFALNWFLRQKDDTAEGFMVAGRVVGLGLGRPASSPPTSTR